MEHIYNLLIFLYFNSILFNVMSAIGVRVGMRRGHPARQADALSRDSGRKREL